MKFELSSRQLAAFAPLVVALSLMSTFSPVQAQVSVTSASLAMVGEPPSLDPMQATTDLVGTIMQHVYEPLFTFDAKWNVVPMLADGMPKYSADGRTVTISLRKGVKLHSGRVLDADDVVMSLKRWIKEAPRGKAVGREVVDLRSMGSSIVEITLREPYAPLLAQLALPSGMAAIMAKESVGIPLRDFIGTGPYEFKERRTDQFVVLTRFDGYSARTEAPSGFSGKREALIDELRFIPVPTPNSRVEGMLNGQYQFADLLPIDALSRLEQSGGKALPVITPAFGFPYLVLNTREGINANKGMRQAIQTALGAADMLAAGFGDKRFYQAEANHFPLGSPYYSTAGADSYNQQNPVKARALADAAGYKGETVRILTSRQYDFTTTWP